MGSVFRGVSNAVSNIFGKPKTKTVVQQHNTQTQNPFDPSGLQAQIDALKNQATAFGKWQSGRQSALSGEAAQRAQNRALYDALQAKTAQTASQLGGFQNQLGGFGNQLASNLAATKGLQSDFQGLGSQVSGLGNVQEQLRSGLTTAQAGLSGLGDTVSGQRSDLASLATTLAAQGASLDKTGTVLSDLGQGFDQLSAGQRDQIQQLYNLAAQGKGVRGVKTSQGLTFTQPRGVGTGVANRDALTFGSLNLA